MLVHRRWGNALWWTRVGLLSFCSQVLVRPPGAIPMPAPTMLHTKSLPKRQKIWGILTTTDVGRLTHFQRGPNH